MKKVKDFRAIGAGMLILALACIAIAFFFPGLRMAIGYGNGYGYPCDTPADCDDANDCTIDTCDPVAGCEWSCNTTDVQDPCCDDAACAEDPICVPGACGGSPAASVHD